MLTVVLDHPDFMVLNKPCGMPMHDSAQAIIPVSEALFAAEKLWLVHRLDTDTSGCIILAKNKQSAAHLSKQFASKRIQKYYIALLDAKPKKKQGMIKGDMKKARNGDWKLSTDITNPAITQFFSFALQANSLSETPKQNKAENKPSHNLAPALRLCVVKPITGKTHQIRVALKSLGSPIVGDKRYKGGASDRLYLHSYAIHFDYKGSSFEASCLPQTGELFRTIESNMTSIPAPWLMQWPAYKQ